MKNSKNKDLAKFEAELNDLKKIKDLISKNKKPNYIDEDKFLDHFFNLESLAFHLKEMLEKIPSICLKYIESDLSLLESFYFSTNDNIILDDFELIINEEYENIISIRPNKIIDTKCKILNCQLENKIYGSFADIPAFSKVINNDDAGVISTYNYEFTMKKFGLSESLIDKTTIYILEEIREEIKNDPNLQMYLNERLNKLLTFV